MKIDYLLAELRRHKTGASPVLSDCQGQLHPGKRKIFLFQKSFCKNQTLVESGASVCAFFFIPKSPVLAERESVKQSLLTSFEEQNSSLRKCDFYLFTSRLLRYLARFDSVQELIISKLVKRLAFFILTRKEQP